ncbi:MAG: hypothetical protein ACYC7E_22960 [Armatimonadota bacterium]
MSYFLRHTEEFGDKVQLYSSRPAFAYAKSDRELSRFITHLQDNRQYLKFEETGSASTCALTMEGIEYISKKEVATKSDQCFVAMQFSDVMLDTYDRFITPAITEAGFHPLIVLDQQHNDDVCDHIIAEIRRSHFLVADFTGHRGGVYFEAGFAYGLGMPVIWTCSASEFDKAHFDVNHYNFIVWETGEDLQKKLQARILATIHGAALTEPTGLT